MNSGWRRHLPWWIGAGLVVLVVASYAQAFALGFVNFDDPRYVYQNPTVLRGVTADGLVWAFSGFHVANWHPLTWLSHMLDVELFGTAPAGHHAVSVGLHAANTVLLFLVLLGATGRAWRSALAAALFAVHPLHVESVAWISERKDVLSTFFWLAGTLAYVAYARRPTLRRMTAVAVALALGLLSKPMVVTFPFTLLLLDFWPLGRLRTGEPASPMRGWWPLVREKLPLFALSAASCVLTVLAQAGGRAVSAEDVLPVGDRIANALWSYVAYLGQAAWPAGLAAVYPHPAFTVAGFPAWKAIAAAVVLAAVSAVVVWQRRRRPYLLFGWLWYLGTLVPVIGLVQVGLQARADRYTYVPLIGIFVAVAWLAADVAERSRVARRAIPVVAGAVVLASAAAAWVQTGYWRDSFSLFGHALQVTHDNSLALRNLGAAYHDARRDDLAVAALEESVRLMPLDAHAWMDLALSHSNLGQHERAAECFQKALRMKPDDAFIWFNLGVSYAMQGRWDEAAQTLARLQQLSPELAQRFSDRILRRVP